MAVIITPESTRFDLFEQYMEAVYGTTVSESLVGNCAATSWRFFAEDLVRQMSEEEFRDAFDYMSRMHDVDVIELDSVASTIMDALECTPEAAAGLREYVFDSWSDSLESLRALDRDLSMCGVWYPDFDALEEDGYTERYGILYEKQDESEPVPCEADVWFDASFGYLVLFR